MRFLSALSLSRKLPVMIAALCVAASVSIAIVGYIDFRANVMQEARKTLRVLTESRRDALLAWFETLSAGVGSFGTDPTFVAAVSAFSNSYDLMIDDAGLREAYVKNNPHPLGQRDQLDQAPESVPYHFQHGQFHPHFRQVNQGAGYYDIFLFNLSGDMIYSAAKESDYATNFVDGPYADTGLAEVFDKAARGEAGAVYFADFAEYAPSNDAPAAFLATPVIGAGGQAIGVAAVQVPQGQIDAIMNSPTGLGETGQVYAVGPDMRTRSTSRFVAESTVLMDVAATSSAQSVLTQQVSIRDDAIGLSGATVLSKGLHVDILGRDWAIIGEMDHSEVTAPAARVRNKMILVTLIVAGLGTLLGWLTVRSVVGPLAQLGGAMTRVSEKDYDVDLRASERKDEIGSLFRSLSAFRDKLKASDAVEEQRQALQKEQAQVVSELSIALTKLADGDLMHTINTPFRGDYDQLRKDYNRTMQNLNQTIGSVAARTGAIRQRSDDMSRSSDDLSRRTENQAATLEQTAAALDELTASVKSAADGAREVKTVVGDARRDAEESEPVVQSAVRAMTEIEGSSNEISQIIGVIDDIAFQTNLLALNAGVEAARAGDAGRGFAVVASEVRALAQRSSDAARQIKSLISESSGQVERGVSLVGQAGDVLTKIAGHISNISDLVAEIASGAEEQSVGLGEINIGVTQLDKVTQQNAAMVEQATASSHALNNDAGELAQVVGQFQLLDSEPFAQAPVDNIAAFRPQPAEPHTGVEGQPAAMTTANASPARLRQQAGNDIWQDF